MTGTSPPSFRAFVAGAGQAGETMDDLAPHEVESLIVKARSELPEVLPIDETFAYRLGELMAKSSSPTVDSLSSLNLSDLYLAIACADGDPQAVAKLRSEYLGDCRAALASQGRPSVDVDDVIQRVFSEVLVAADGGRPRIATYSGRGPLRRWLRSVAVRIASRSARHQAKEVAVEDAVLEHSSGQEDLELEHLRDAYREDFKRGFEAALRALPVRERNLLRQYFVDGMTVDAMSRLYGVHRSTCARWVTAARQRVLEDASNRICGDLGLESEEMMSVLRLVRSRLDLSVDRALKSQMSEVTGLDS